MEGISIFMSHKTILQTSMDNLSTVKEALLFLGIEYKENTTVRMWSQRDNTNSNIVIPQTHYDIGILNKNNKISVIGDSMAFPIIFQTPSLKKYKAKTPNNVEKFTGILNQAYNIVKAREKALELGHQMSISAPDENNTIHAQILIGE